MKKEINPGIAAVIIVVVLVVMGGVWYVSQNGLPGGKPPPPPDGIKVGGKVLPRLGGGGQSSGTGAGAE